MSEPPLAAPVCPGCNEPPVLVLDGGRQVFCGNDWCQVLTWDMWQPPERFKADAVAVELPEWLGGEWPSG